MWSFIRFFGTLIVLCPGIPGMPAKANLKNSNGGRRPRPVIVKKGEVRAAATAAPSQFLSRAKTNLAVCLMLAAVTFALYFRALGNPFVNYDDQGYIVENQNVQQGITIPMLRWALTATDASNWHPVTWISHALDCQLYGLHPAGHHLTSVLLHVINVVLLFLLLARVTGSTTRSLLVAGLFALHPISVESVAWIAERKNVLCTLFFLLTLGFYGWYARRPNVGRFLAVMAAFILGLAAKPMVVTLPFVLLLVDFWPLQRVAGWVPVSREFPVPQIPFRWLVLEKLPLLLCSAASSVITVVAQKSAIATNVGLPFIVRVANAIYAYSMYIVKALFPFRLASFYPYEGLRLAGWQVLLCLAFLVAVTVWVWRERAHLYLPVGWLWFLGTLVPVIGVVQVGDQAMADRYAYLPLIGIFSMLVWGIADWAGKYKFNLAWRLGPVAVVFIVLSFLTWRQIGYWNSSYNLWSHALQVTKDNYMAEDYVGTALLANNYEATGQRYSDEALVHFQNAVRIEPNDSISHLNLGADLHEHGKLKEAIQQYLTVLSLTRDPHLVMKSFIDLGAAYQQLGDFQTARQYYLQALKMQPGSQVIVMNLGKLAMQEKIQELVNSASSHPTPEGYLQLGQFQQAAGYLPDARSSYQMALKLNPKLADARDALERLPNQGQ